MSVDNNDEDHIQRCIERLEYVEQLSATAELDEALINELTTCLTSLEIVHNKETNRLHQFVLEGLHAKIKNKIVALQNYLNEKLPTNTDAVSDNIIPEDILSIKTVPSVQGFSDIGGLNDTINQLKCEVQLRITQPQLFENVGDCKSILLYGPPGTGKTRIVHALAAELEADLYCITAADVLDKYVGQSEKTLQRICDYMGTVTRLSILLIDEIDGLCHTRMSGEASHTRRFKAELLVQLQKFDSYKNVYLIAATNCPWDVDTAFLRRFNKHIYFPLPDANDRKSLLQMFCKNTAMAEKLQNADITREIIDMTKGYSGCDLHKLVQHALAQPLLELQDVSIWTPVLDELGAYLPRDCADAQQQASRCRAIAQQQQASSSRATNAQQQQQQASSSRATNTQQQASSSRADAQQQQASSSRATNTQQLQLQQQASSSRATYAQQQQASSSSATYAQQQQASSSWATNTQVIVATLDQMPDGSVRARAVTMEDLLQAAHTIKPTNRSEDMAKYLLHIS